MSGSMRRRDLLILGAAAFSASNCVYFRWGASHEKVESPASSLSEGTLRIPLEELARVENGDVLEVEPGKPYPALLVTKKDGEYLIVTAECGHWGCTVDWEPSSAEWQCPCHGSRYNAKGEILEGPAEQALKSVSSSIAAGTLQVDLRPLAPS